MMHPVAFVLRVDQRLCYFLTTRKRVFIKRLLCCFVQETQRFNPVEVNFPTLGGVSCDEVGVAEPRQFWLAAGSVKSCPELMWAH